VIAAKEAGAEKIIVTGLANPTDKKRLAMAKHLGAHHTVCIGEEDLLETVAELTGGLMADLVIDCASGGTGVSGYCHAVGPEKRASDFGWT
jgi:threonine dehydrogenase-like Zn-dependent dehydrogenase